mgnify:CR=1 FL=1
MLTTLIVNIKYAALLVSFICLSACFSAGKTKSNQNMTVQTEKTSVLYRYADGNGNSYVINQKDSDIIEFEYDPVEPIESSSGEYSGGIAVKKKITPEEFEQVKEVFNQAKADVSAHTSVRAMGTGHLTIQENGAVTLDLMLSYRSSAQKAVEEVLNQFRQ